MKRTFSLSLRLLLAAVLLNSTLLCLGKTEILDPAAYHPILREIADVLDPDGIDVVQDWRSKIGASPRPIIAPLAKYPISGMLGTAEWIRDFNSGAMGAILAFKTKGKLKHDTFRKQWYHMPVEQRIFLSFTRSDAAHAQRVRAALEAKGYTVFTYIKHAEDKLTEHSLSVGEYFSTAGVHLVIDTDEARNSQGVLAEALALVTYRGTQSMKGDVVQIYGAKIRCPRTREAIRRYTEAGALIVYYDIDADPEAKKVLAENRAWLVEGKYLPFIKVNGKPLRFRSNGLKETGSIFNPDSAAPQSCTADR